MAQFTVRIELHGAQAEDYDRLHAAMETYNYHRYVSGVDGEGKAGVWAIPTAEYDYESTATAAQVRDHAKSIADTIRKGSWCLVTQSSDRSWSTAKIK